MKSPFKFLDAYTLDDREIFFGRDNEIEELYQRVFESRILLLYGISGTGKTSLINCGLASKFEESDWLPVNIRRGRDINRSLFEAVRKEAILPIKDGTSIKKSIESVYLDHFKPMYLIFDQFEELFIYGNKHEREEFIQSISQIVESDIQCKCLFSIREEYLARVTEFERNIPEFLANRMRVERMTRQHAKDVIEGPCRVNGIAVETGFSDSLLQRLNPGSNEVELTYLQVFLDKIFKLSGDGKRFAVDQIDDVGNVTDLLGAFLEEQIGVLDDPDSGLAVLKAFVSIQGTKKQIGAGEIIDFTQTLGTQIDQEELTALLNRFVNLRVLKEKDEYDQYELRHDSLAVKIFEKITLVEKELLEIKDFLESAFNNYKRRGIFLNEEDLKYIGPYEDKIFLKRELQQFLNSSKNEIARSQRRKRRLIAAAIATLMVILTFFTAWALQERGKALEQNIFAEKQRQEALRARDLAIQAEEEAVSSRNEAERLRIESDAAKDEALLQKQLTDSALLVAEYQRNLSESERQRAQNLYVEANEQRQIAQVAQLAAEKSSMEVKEASRKAMFQLYLFNAQEFASKSLLIEKNDTLAALLALSAIELVGHGYSNYADIGEIESYDIRLQEALQKALHRLKGEMLYEEMHWALDMKKDKVVISDHDGQVRLFDFLETEPGGFPTLVGKSNQNQGTGEKTELKLIDTREYTYLRHMIIDQQNNRLICGNSSGTVSLVELEGKDATEIYNHRSNISSVQYLPEQTRIISASEDHILIIYEIKSRTVVNVNLAGFNSNNLTLLKERYCVVHDKRGNFFRIDILADSPLPEKLFALNRQVDAFDLHSNMNMAASAGSGNLVLMKLSENGSQLLQKKEIGTPHTGKISDVLFSPNGRWLVLSGFDGLISIWDLSSPDLFEQGEPEPILLVHGDKIRRILFDVESRYLLYSDLRKIYIYPVDMENNLKILSQTLSGRKLTDSEWFLYVKGEIDRPDPYEN